MGLFGIFHQINHLEGYPHDELETPNSYSIFLQPGSEETKLGDDYPDVGRLGSSKYGGFHSHGGTPKWLVYMEKPSING